MKLGRILKDDLNHYYPTSCGFRTLNLTSSVPIEECLGSGGFGRRNVMRVPFLDYNLSQTYEKRVETKMVDSHGKTYDKQMAKPVLSRWEHVVTGARYLN